MRATAHAVRVTTTRWEANASFLGVDRTLRGRRDKTWTFAKSIDELTQSWTPPNFLSADQLLGGSIPGAVANSIN